MATIQPKVTLVGAGPGDPDLLSIKGAKALADAQVVLYDALANDILLDYAPNALKIFVGKRKNKHTYKQDEINQMLVDYALIHGHVVRLKGGDPFVFGRGSEEVDYCESFGIPTQVIPGISSSIAAPAYNGISITQRGVSESFWVITGTTTSRQLSKDIELAVQSKATVVVLMGMSKLPEIVKLYQQHYKNDLPIAIIQNGTTENEKMGFGTIDTILEVVREKELANPSVIVIGEVVKNSPKIMSYYSEMFYEDEFLFQNLNLTPFSKK